MARDPDVGDAFVFDLVDDDAPAGAAQSGKEARGSPPVPGRRRRITAQLAGVLAIVLGTGVAIDSALDHQRMERMRDIPGGVADLTSPLTETWAWSGAVGPGEGATDVAVLGDVLAVESDNGLVALDPATGDVAWTVPLREHSDCGPMVPPSWPDPATESLVCLQGTGSDRTVVAVGPDGPTSAPRLLTAADARRYGVPHTGPDGTVLRAWRVGPPSAVDLGDAECTSAGECTGTVAAGRDLVLRAEDAVTGEERWVVTVPFRAVDATQCTRTFRASWGSSETRLVLSGQLAPDAFGARVTADLIDLNGCGVQAAVTPDGTVLGAELEPGRGRVTSLGGGRYAGTSFDGVARATLFTADGDVAGGITGFPLGPRATDRSEPTAVLGVDEPGRRLRAYAADGTPRWDITLQSGGQDFLAQVGDTVVITTGAGRVRGLELATGEERWAWEGSDQSEPDGGYFGSAFVVQAFTDGERVLLLTEGDTGGTQGLVTLEAASGAVVWDRPGGGAVTSFDPTDDYPVEQGVVGGLVAVDGHLLEVTPRGVRGLG
jgi:outer membrane protein assembly factor BamB